MLEATGSQRFRMVLAACGRWQRPSDWIQWVGIGVGIGWIGLGIVDSVFRSAVDV